MTNTSSLTIGIVAGEVSGDALGGDFMQKMNALHPNIRWVGVGGRSMAAQGLSSVIDMGRLSVMGLAEVMMHLPDLLKAKSKSSQRLKRIRLICLLVLMHPILTFESVKY